MQLMPKTQQELRVNNAFDPRQNVYGGTRYLVTLVRRYDSVKKALWAYNAGPGRIELGIVLEESRKYANNVLREYWRLRAETTNPTHGDYAR